VTPCSLCTPLQTLALQLLSLEDETGCAITRIHNIHSARMRGPPRSETSDYVGNSCLGGVVEYLQKDFGRTTTTLLQERQSQRLTCIRGLLTPACLVIWGLIDDVTTMEHLWNCLPTKSHRRDERQGEARRNATNLAAVRAGLKTPKNICVEHMI
jgi:hypothetical protein